MALSTVSPSTGRADLSAGRHKSPAWSRHAAPRPAAIGKLKIDDAVGVLHDSPVRGTCRQAPRLRAMHALILAHQPHQRAVFALVLVEENQVPVIPARLRHRLVGVSEN